MFDLKVIKDRYEAATEGPWESSGHDVFVGIFGKGYRIALGCDLPDSKFIAHARTDLPACIAEIERLQAIEQCTKCKHGYPETGATCPGHADGELSCAGFETREALEQE